MWIAFVATLVPLGFAIYTVIAKGVGAISWQFLTSHTTPRIGPPRPLNIPGLNLNTGGAGPAIVGTLEITALAAVIAIPLGVLGAIYIQEYGGKGFLAKFISFMADVMTGVPLIVMGLFIYTIWVLHFGYSGMAGSFALACLMLPIVIKSTQEMLRLVPDSLRQGSYALGATKSRVTVTVVLLAEPAESSVAPCSPWPEPPARRRRCYSPSSGSTERTRTCSAAPTPRGPQIFAEGDLPVSTNVRPGPRWVFTLTLNALTFLADRPHPRRDRPLPPLHAPGTVMEQPAHEVARPRPRCPPAQMNATDRSSRSDRGSPPAGSRPTAAC